MLGGRSEKPSLWWHGSETWWLRVTSCRKIWVDQAEDIMAPRNDLGTFNGFQEDLGAWTDILYSRCQIFRMRERALINSDQVSYLGSSFSRYSPLQIPTILLMVIWHCHIHFTIWHKNNHLTFFSFPWDTPVLVTYVYRCADCSHFSHSHMNPLIN